MKNSLSIKSFNLSSFWNNALQDEQEIKLYPSKYFIGLMDFVYLKLAEKLKALNLIAGFIVKKLKKFF